MIAVHAGAGYHSDDIEKLCATAIREAGFDPVKAVMVNFSKLFGRREATSYDKVENISIAKKLREVQRNKKNNGDFYFFF